MTLFIMALCCLAPAQDLDEMRVRLKDPAQVFPIFQSLIRAGRYADAYNYVLSGKTKAEMPYEVFYSALTTPEMSYDVSKRLLNELRVHKADGDARTVELCNSEFGFRHTLRLGKFASLWEI